MFDNKTLEMLEYYVYALINLETNIPLHIGIGVGNRIVNYKHCAIQYENSNLKLDTTRDIINENLEVGNIIIRHNKK